MQSNVSSGSNKRRGHLAFHSAESLSLASSNGPAKKKNIRLDGNPFTAGKLDSCSGQTISKMESNEMLLPPSTGKNVVTSGSHDKKDRHNLPQNSLTVLTGKKTSVISKSADIISSMKEKNISQENSAIPIKEGTSLVSKGKHPNTIEKSMNLKSSEKQIKLSGNEQLSTTDSSVKQDRLNNSSSASQHSDGQSSGSVMSALPSFQPSLSSQLSRNMKTLRGESFQKSQPRPDGMGVVMAEHLMVGETGKHVQKPTYATVTEKNNFSPPLNMGDDQRLSPERGIYLLRISEASLSDYADAITAAIGESGLTHISLVSRKHVLAFLSDVSHVKFLVINGLSLRGKFLNPAFMRPPAQKIVLSNVYPLISNLDIIKVLEPFGRVIPNSFRAIRASTNQKNVLSFRKEILFVAKENIEVPMDVQVSVFGYTFRIYLSRDGLKCSRCNKPGHPSSKCKQNVGGVEALPEADCAITNRETVSDNNLALSESISEGLHKSEIVVSDDQHTGIGDALDGGSKKLSFTNLSVLEDSNHHAFEEKGASMERTNQVESKLFKVPAVPRQGNIVSSKKVITTQSSECFDPSLVHESTVQDVTSEHPEIQQNTLKEAGPTCNDEESSFDEGSSTNLEEDEGSDSDASLQGSIYSMDSIDNEVTASEMNPYDSGPLTLEQIKSLLRRIHKKQGETRLNIVKEYTNNFDALKFQLETLFITGKLWKNKSGRDRKLRSSKSCLKHLIKTVDLLDQIADEEYESENSFGGMD